ncbi:hypothetical protein BHE90_013251 [Fusarium euwallaceae]|uniref:Uncharacterized protein n=1 Tax=Fusarium euwallaceae TaxID=1147111 RepID=A0A430L9L9_9HYPO|nr:hypothetical protein BHE90_013251 [Fusarium euwallaceae]
MLPHVPHPSSASDTPRNPPVRDSDFPKSCQSGSLRLPALNHLPATGYLPVISRICCLEDSLSLRSITRSS